MNSPTAYRPTAPTSADTGGSRVGPVRSWVVPGSGAVPVPGTRTAPRIVNLPPLSETVARAAALAADPAASLQDFAALVEGDPALTALLLRRANSAAVGAAATSARHAVALLGLRTCSQLVATVGLRGLLRDAPPPVAARCEEVLRHSVFVAHLAAHLNRIGGLGFRGEEFVAGLLHDVGRVLLALTRPDEAAAADPLDYDEPPERLARERVILGTDHCAAGAEFAAASKLAPAVVRAVLKHHTPFDDAGEHRPLTALVAVADHLANHVKRVRRVADYDPWSGFGYGVLSERWPADRHDRFAAVVLAAVVAAMRGTRATLRLVPASGQATAPPH